jgi:hypothetical protein
VARSLQRTNKKIVSDYSFIPLRIVEDKTKHRYILHPFSNSRVTYAISEYE